MSPFAFHIDCTDDFGSVRTENRYNDLRSRRTERRQIPRIGGYVTDVNDSSFFNRGAGQPFADRESRIFRRTWSVPNEVDHFVCLSVDLIEADPTIVAAVSDQRCNSL